MPLPKDEDWFSVVPFSAPSSNRRKGGSRRLNAPNRQSDQDSASDEWEKKGESENEESSGSGSDYISSSLATPSENNSDCDK